MIIAIDPGVSGGIAVNFQDEDYEVYKMPETASDFKDFMIAACPTLNGNRIWLEDVARGQWAPNMTAMCKLARHAGQLEGVLIGLGYPYRTVPPKDWQKHYPGLPKGADKKKAIRERMAAMYPELKVTLWNADALAIMTWVKEAKRT